MKAKKTILICSIIAIILLCLPLLLFQMQDFVQSKKVMVIDKPYTINAQAADIKLVNNIHAKSYEAMNSSDGFIYDQQDLLEKKRALDNEVKKLYDSNLIDDFLLKKYEQIQTSQDYNVYQFNRLISYDENYGLKSNNYHMGGISMDPSTNKILSLALPYNKKIKNQKELAYKYIQYLGLDILGDWVYEGNSYYSKKAQLYVYVLISETNFEEGPFSYFKMSIMSSPIEYSEESVKAIIEN